MTKVIAVNKAIFRTTLSKKYTPNSTDDITASENAVSQHFFVLVNKAEE